MAEEKRLRVGLLFGGRSSEHEVSLMSARSVLEALDPARYEIVQIGITKEGRWLVAGDAVTRLVERAGASGALEGEPEDTAPADERTGAVTLSEVLASSGRSAPSAAHEPGSAPRVSPIPVIRGPAREPARAGRRSP